MHVTCNSIYCLIDHIFARAAGGSKPCAHIVSDTKILGNHFLSFHIKKVYGHGYILATPLLCYSTLTHKRLFSHTVYISFTFSLDYTLSPEAAKEFGDFYNELGEMRTKIPFDEDRRAVLAKMRGKTARLAMAIHVYEQAVRLATRTTAATH